MSRLSQIAVACLVLALALVACVPWREYPVSPVIEGRVAGSRVDAATLRLEVRNQSSKTLGTHRVVRLEPDGRFRLDPIVLRLAGREFFKLYSVFLYLEGSDGRSSVIWRSEWYRDFFGDRLELECELQRPLDYGQVCRVVDPVSHRWLVSNGQLEFQRSCVECHAVGATGHGLGAAALETEPPDLTRLAARRGGVFNRDEVHSWIDGRRRTAAHGTGEMPTWGFRMAYESESNTEDLTAARIDAIVTYLESLQRPAEDAADGK